MSKEKQCCIAQPLTEKQKDELIELRFNQLAEAKEKIAELESKVKITDNMVGKSNQDKISFCIEQIKNLIVNIK